MTIKRRYLPPMLLAVAAAASIATAPAALAEQSCTYPAQQHRLPGTWKCADRQLAAPGDYVRSFPNSAATCSSSTMAAMADIARTVVH